MYWRNTKMLALAVSMTAAVLLSGCSTAGVVSPVSNGTLFTSVKGPVTATGASSEGSRSGSGSAFNILGLVAIGDASIDSAKRQGGIKTVTHVDYESFTVLGLFSSFKVVVHGD